MEINEQHAAILVKRVLDSNNETEKVNLVSGIDGQKIPIHRVVLTATSQYFADLLQGNDSDMESRFILADSDGETIKTVVDYCYSGNIVLTEQNASKCLQVAVNEDFDLLFEKCHEYFSSKLSVDGAVQVVTIADEHNLVDLRQRALELIGSKTEKVPVADIVQLNHSMMQRLLENGQEKELIAGRLIDWFQHDEDGRGEHMPELLRLIRLDQLKVQFLTETIEPLFVRFKCFDLLVKEYKRRVINSACTSCSDSRPPSEDSDALSRTMQSGRMEKVDMKSIFIVCVFESPNTTIAVHKYDKSIKGFTRHFTPPSNDVLGFGSVLYGNKLFVIGGQHNGILDSVIAYDLTTRKKRRLAPMNEPRCNFTSIVMGKCIYVFGGRTKHSWFSRSCERYDTETKEWEEIKSMSPNRHIVSAAIVNGAIYVASVDLTNKLRNYTLLESYDPKTNEWTVRKSLDGVGNTSQLFVVDGTLYGFVDLIFQRYDSELDEWTEMDKCSLFWNRLSLTFRYWKTIVVNDSLFVLNDDKRTLKQMKIDVNKMKIKTSKKANVPKMSDSFSIHHMG